MTTKLTANLEDQVTCPICLELYQDPRLLPCLHTYCKQCLENLLKTGAREFSIQCPECREIAQVEDVNSLKVNIWVNKSLYLLEQSKSDKKRESVAQISCDNCNRGQQAKVKCLDCEKYMCDSCVTEHQNNATNAKHSHVILQEVKGSASSYCATHKGLELKVFCKSCEMLVCSDCTIIGHKDHNYCLAVDIIKEEKDKVTTETKKAIIIKEEVKCQLKTLQMLKNKLVTDVRHTEKAIDTVINKQIQAHVQAFETKRRNLKGELVHDVCSQLNKMSTREDDLLLKFGSLTSTIEFSHSILANGKISDVLSVSKDITSTLAKHSSTPAKDDFEDLLLQVPLIQINENLLTYGISYDIEDFIVLSLPDLSKCEVKWSLLKGLDVVEIHIKDSQYRSLNMAKRRITIHNVENDRRNLYLERQLFQQPLGNGSLQWTLANPKIHRTQPLCSSDEMDRHSSIPENGPAQSVNIKIDGQIVKGNPVNLCFWLIKFYHALRFNFDHRKRK